MIQKALDDRTSTIELESLDDREFEDWKDQLTRTYFHIRSGRYSDFRIDGARWRTD